ncbi:glycosyltransferase family 4 protein [Bradyrhizobium sp. WYCCWR 13023]|uniref:Glycosyltransferase family 4 protein n=1 Tax=Bradyrhizobium zhengyangense TaxID=2911009 RepID=A0A9X1RG87_9BRAD|nr:glycosyltransferase family 4 protein [Bradyrhizobium zhengyangense]MCG2630708.1 glycosyltransferase family 4 protein [Bradyrhizobium zhengyangense]
MPVSVAHVLRTYGVHGGERQLARLFREDDGSLYENTFFSIYSNPHCAEYFATIPNLSQKTVIKMKAKAFPKLRNEMLLLLLLLPILQLRMLYLLAMGNYRICVAHGIQGAAACWLAAWLLPRIRFVYVHRGTKSKAGSHPIFRLLYRPYRVVAGVSAATAESLRPLVPDGRTVTLENGIDWEAFVDATARCEKRCSPNITTLVSSARLLPHKAQAFLLDAFAILVRERPNVELIVAGDGPERGNLMGQADALGIAGRVRFLGHVDDIQCHLMNSDIFIHASEVEGMSNAVLEAMALGLPSVVVDAPGVTECHIEGKTGFVVQRSPSDMANKLIALIDDVELRQRMGAQARTRVQEQYSIKANVARYHSLYANLLAAI